VVQHPDKRFLLVQETAKHDFLWWLPGGRVEHGDSFYKTSIKETSEEGGIGIIPIRLLKIEQSSVERMRFIYYALPADGINTPENPKTVADKESTQAIWTTLENISKPPISKTLRGNEPKSWFTYLKEFEVTNIGAPTDLVHSSEVDETTLTESELKKKQNSATQRLPHKTVTVVEVIVCNNKGQLFVSSNNQFPAFYAERDCIRNVPVSRMDRFFEIDIELVAILKVEREESLESPNSKMTVVYVALRKENHEDDMGNDYDGYFWKKKTECLFADRELELLANLCLLHMYPLCLIDHEDGKAPKKQNLDKCQQTIKKIL